MLVVVGSGMRVGALNDLLAGGGQEWMSDLPADATVGGVIASAASGPRRLKLGAVRDSVVEAELVTGDGRFVRSGARTVKNVTGYDLHRLVCGSLGTLAIIVQVAIKVRPLPQARRTLRFDGGLELARSLLGAVPGAAGGPRDGPVGGAAPRGVGRGGGRTVGERRRGRRAHRRDRRRPVPLRRAVGGDAPWSPRSRSRRHDSETCVIGEAWGALAGVGIAWVGLPRADGALGDLRERVRAAGGIAPVIRGPGGLGDDTMPAPEVHRRLKASFDPNGVLAPGRFWGRA